MQALTHIHQHGAHARPMLQNRLPLNKLPICSIGTRLSSTSGTNASNEPYKVPELSYPGLMFPEGKWWIFSKAEAKSSIKAQSKGWWHSAEPWLLNIVNVVHWFAFPVGIWVAYNIFSLYLGQTTQFAKALTSVYPGDIPARVFCIILGILTQTFSALTGLMMHEYEGWMIAPFANIAALPKHLQGGGGASKDVVDQVSVQKYNNAWLRSVAYYYLFLTQAFGLLCFAIGAMGFQTPVVVSSAVAVAIMVLVPGKVQTFFKVRGQPVMPLSWPMIAVFAFSVIINLMAYYQLFGSSVAALTPLGAWYALVPPLVTAMGGIVEGTFAEGFFNQWVHVMAVLVMLSGLYLHNGLYVALVSRV